MALALLGVLGLSSCAQNLYPRPQYNFAGRPTPPSGLGERVLVSLTPSGSSGALEILDGLRDIRGNVQNTIPAFGVSGFAGGYPNQILSFPEQLRAYVVSGTFPNPVAIISYATESATGNAGMFPGVTSIASPPSFTRFYAAEESAGELVVTDNRTGQVVGLSLPNVYRVAVNQGDTVALAMVRNSDTLYRVIKLNNGATFVPGAVDCQPLLQPSYCVVPVPGAFDRPTDAYFSTDGSQAYVVNCGQECGGGGNGGASVTFLPQGPLTVDTIPASAPYPTVVTTTVPIPGGATVALTDGTTLYVAGQQLQADGLYSGRLTTVTLGTLSVSAPVAISDGFHSKLILGDDNTLWIGSQFCATGERAKLGLNYNCLTRFDLGTRAATIVPALSAATASAPAQVPYPNQNGNLQYYGSLTGICWVQNKHKMYTAYGGQVHAFNTVDGTEINNYNITVQGTALDVAYMDALTNTAN